jgi:hypothetical protein
MRSRLSLPICAFGLIVLACVSAPGCHQKEPAYKPNGEPKTNFTMRLAKEEPFPGGKELVPPKGKEPSVVGIVVKRLYVSEESVLTNEHVAGTSVTPAEHDPGFWQVNVFLTPIGRERLRLATRKTESICFLVIFFDDQYEMAPAIYREMNDEVSPIWGGLDEAKASALARKFAGE